MICCGGRSRLRSLRPRLLLPEYSKSPKKPATNCASEYWIETNARQSRDSLKRLKPWDGSCDGVPRLWPSAHRKPAAGRLTCYISTHRHFGTAESSVRDSFKLHHQKDLFDRRYWLTECSSYAWN